MNNNKAQKQQSLDSRLLRVRIIMRTLPDATKEFPSGQRLFLCQTAIVQVALRKDWLPKGRVFWLKYQTPYSAKVCTLTDGWSRLLVDSPWASAKTSCGPMDLPIRQRRFWPLEAQKTMSSEKTAKVQKAPPIQLDKTQTPYEEKRAGLESFRQARLERKSQQIEAIKTLKFLKVAIEKNGKVTVAGKQPSERHLRRIRSLMSLLTKHH